MSLVAYETALHVQGSWLAPAHPQEQPVSELRGPLYLVASISLLGYRQILSWPFIPIHSAMTKHILKFSINGKWINNGMDECYNIDRSE